jgi:leucyl-tRNA synthetase
MATTTKLLRLDKSGLLGKTGFVGVDRDDPAEFLVTEITGIPIWRNFDRAWQWIQERYTNTQLRQMGRSINGREKDIWMLLWQAEDMQTDIDNDLIECDADLVLVTDATIATMRLIVERAIKRDKRALRQTSRLIRVAKRIVLLMAPDGDEAA